MIQIIPAINVEKFEDLIKQVRAVEPYAGWVHFDAADGTFTSNEIWHEPFDLLNFKTDLFIEVHLMVAKPEKKIDRWLVPWVRRVIVHFETVRDLNEIIKKCRKAKVEIGVAINPETPEGVLKPFCEKVDLIQILAVKPGLAGQKFDERALRKIHHLRRLCPLSIIEVDGGIQVGVARQAVRAGADILVSASAIFGTGKSVEYAIRELKNDAVAGLLEE